MPKKTSKYIGDCSVKGVANKFKKLEYMSNISHSISTGNKMIDKQISKYATKAINSMVKGPRLKAVINISGKMYPYTEKTGANIARAITAYKENCKKRK